MIVTANLNRTVHSKTIRKRINTRRENIIRIRLATMTREASLLSRWTNTFSDKFPGFVAGFKKIIKTVGDVLRPAADILNAVLEEIGIDPRQKWYKWIVSAVKLAGSFGIGTIITAALRRLAKEIKKYIIPIIAGLIIGFCITAIVAKNKVSKKKQQATVNITRLRHKFAEDDNSNKEETTSEEQQITEQNVDDKTKEEGKNLANAIADRIASALVAPLSGFNPVTFAEILLKNEFVAMLTRNVSPLIKKCIPKEYQDWIPTEKLVATVSSGLIDGKGAEVANDLVKVTSDQIQNQAKEILEENCEKVVNELRKVTKEGKEIIEDPNNDVTKDTKVEDVPETVITNTEEKETKEAKRKRRLCRLAVA